MRLLSDVRRDADSRGLGSLSPGSHEPDVMYAWYKHLWATQARQEAFAGVQHLAAELHGAATALLTSGASQPDASRLTLAAKVYLKLGLWRRQLTEELSEGSIAAIMTSLKAATESAPAWGKAWHHWAYFNCEAMVYYGGRGADVAAAQRFVAPAVTGFFRSIELGQAAGGCMWVGGRLWGGAVGLWGCGGWGAGGAGLELAVCPVCVQQLCGQVGG